MSTISSLSATPRRIVRNEALTPREKLDLLGSIAADVLEDADYRLPELAPVEIDAAMQQVRREAAAEPCGEVWRTEV